MDKNKKTIIVISGLLLLGGIAYFLTKKAPTTTEIKGRSYWVNNIYNHVIDKPTGADYERLIAYEDGYLKAWSEAVDNAVKSFSFNGKTYSTTTGSVVL